MSAKNGVMQSKYSYAFSVFTVTAILILSGILLSPLVEGIALSGWLIPLAIGVPAFLIVASGCYFIFSKENTTGGRSAGFVVVGWGLTVYATTILVILNFLVKI